MQGRATQSPRSKKPHRWDPEEAGPSSLLCPQWNLLPQQPGRAPETELGAEEVSAEAFQGPEVAEAGFVGLSDPRQSGGPERRLSFRPAHSGPVKGVQRWGPGGWLSFTLLPLEASSASGCHGNYGALGSQREMRAGKIRPVNRRSNNNKLSLCTSAHLVTSTLPFTKAMGGLLTHNFYCHCPDQKPGTHLAYK